MEPIFVLIAIALVIAPFVLPVVSLLRQRALRRRVDTLEAALDEQRQQVADLRRQLSRATTVASTSPSQAPTSVVPQPASQPAPPPPSSPAPPLAPPPPTPPLVTQPSAPAPVPPPPTVRPPAPAAPATPATPATPAAPRAAGPAATSESLPDLVADLAGRIGAAVTPGLDLRARVAGFDWEQLVGVRLFSAISGIALVLAAIFFLRYSLDRGWLAPAVRVAIGVIVGTALLVVCELRAAHRYRVTANALDAAAIAILFATFFAAHALWQLIPGAVTFGLLALVTALAVLLAIRHDSLFIALLGLIGGFATPALLSTGENRPIPLFVYLLLLNIGLAWVAVRKSWPLLSLLTLGLTTLYQWGWVMSFLAQSDLRLGMTVFLVFAVASFMALASGRRTATGTMRQALEGGSLAASVMPLAFAVFLAAVPRYGANTGLLFGFLLLVVVGLSVTAALQRDDRLHAIGALATVLVFAFWLATSYRASGSIPVLIFVTVFASWFAMAPWLAERLQRPLSVLGWRSVYAAPVLLFVFPVIVRLDPATARPWLAFGAMFVTLAVIAWRALATSEAGLYYVAGFFAVAAQASWSLTHLVAARLPSLVAIDVAFAVFYLGVPLAWRRRWTVMPPAWGNGVLLLVNLALLLFLSLGPHEPAGLWGLALLLAILNAGLFVESVGGRLPWLSAAGGALSWFVLFVWWSESGAAVGLLPSLLVLVGLALLMLAGHAWAARQTAVHAVAGTVGTTATPPRLEFRHGVYLAAVAQLFLFRLAGDPQWATPPWPVFGALAVITLATTAAALWCATPSLHAVGVTAAALVVAAFASSASREWAATSLLAAEGVIAYAVYVAYGLVARDAFARSRPDWRAPAMVACGFALFIGELSLANAGINANASLLVPFALVHAVNLALILAIAWREGWPYVAPAAAVPAWQAATLWIAREDAGSHWSMALALPIAMYAVLAAYPFALGARGRDSREPAFTAVAGSLFFFFAGRQAFTVLGLQAYMGAVPVVAGGVLALLLRQLLTLQPAASRDLGRLAVVAAATLGFVTVAIPLQLQNQWVTIGWALEGAALAWLYTRVPHKGLLAVATGLLAVVFVRLAVNPAIFFYEPRGTWRIFNWYLYTYLTCSLAMLAASYWLSRLPAGDDRPVARLPRSSTWLPAAAVILLFIVVNIEVADYYATGPEITFRFGVTLAQDLTYTISWLVFGLLLLTAGIFLHNRYGRMAAVALVAITASKAFLYDLGSLGGLYRVGSLVGLAVSLSLVALALQKFVLQSPKESS